jgi:hypothetical protein
VHLIEAPVRVMTATCGAHIRVPALLYTSLQHLGRRLATERRLCPIPKPWRTLAVLSHARTRALFSTNSSSRHLSCVAVYHRNSPRVRTESWGGSMR